jgi:hypothetical protein
MPIDIGGGTRGEGNAPLADSVDVTPVSPATGRTVIDYNPVNSRIRLEARLAQERLEEIDPTTIAPYLVRVVGNDVILGSPIYNGVASTRQVIIAKPYDLRRTPFDGKTIGDYSYVYTSATARTRTQVSTGTELEQTIQEPYSVNNDIVWAAVAESTAITTTTLLDLNISAKAWSGGGAAEINRYRLVTEGGDTLSCFLLDADGADTGSEVLIAKPPLLRRTPFDGQTYNGISYVYTGNSARGATKGAATQDEIVIYPYLDGISIIHALNVSNGTGITDVVLIDTNVDARLWGRK